MNRSAKVIASFLGGGVSLWFLVSYLRCAIVLGIGSSDSSWGLVPLATLSLFALELVLLAVVLGMMLLKAKEHLPSLDVLDSFKRGTKTGVYVALASTFLSVILFALFKPGERERSELDPFTSLMLPASAESVFAPDRITTMREGRKVSGDVVAAARAAVYGQLLIIIAWGISRYAGFARRTMDEFDEALLREYQSQDHKPRGGGKTDGW